jgi:hypothetical protein
MNRQLQTQQKAALTPTASFPSAQGILQRRCACVNHRVADGDCEACKQKREGTLQRAAISPSQVHEAPAIVHEVLRSPGQPLDAGTRAFVEPRFGHDFSQVRVHTDGRAAESARAVNSLAYTVGREVVFGTGQYAPATSTGQRLLAHELTHVVQQQGALVHSLTNSLRIGSPNEASDREADTVANQLISHGDISVPEVNPLEVQVSRKGDPFAEGMSSAEEPKRRIGSTLPYREATELTECIRIMGDANADYCRQTVLGESPPTPGPAPSSLSVNPTEVRPRGTGGVDTATVIVTGAMSGAMVSPTVTASANSGGHQHQNQRPVGTIRPASRKADASGRANFTYRSNLAGGIETIAATVGGGVQADISVRVPGLVELAAGADYDQVGQTAIHPDNHFGAAATIASLQTIAANFEAHKVANNLPAWPRVAYNDISLERGGIFDINGDWAPPHQTHRVGQTVDFRTNHLSAAQMAVLRGIINAEGATILNEGNHWHLTF